MAGLDRPCTLKLRARMARWSLMAIELHTPAEHFAVVSLPLACYRELLGAISSCECFVSVTRDVDEVSLIIAEVEWLLLADRWPHSHVVSGRRLIRFDTVLEFSIVGFLAEVARILAEAGISILAISTFRTDALLVEDASFDRAVSLLRESSILKKLPGIAGQSERELHE
jgi:hypothetical protein